MLPPLQHQLSRWGGAGNEQAYLGRDGWLFYRPGVDYLTGPGFLDSAVLFRRSQSGNSHASAPQPDPRSAILDFHRQLQERGIQLVLLPAPVKAGLEPEHLSPRYTGSTSVLQNPSYDEFRRQMEEAGVLVFDPAPLLLAEKAKSGEAQYLQTDTHWTPAAMERVASALRDFIDQHVPLPPQPGPQYYSRSKAVENLGDIAVMLKLPEEQQIFQSQRVRIHQVSDTEGFLWQPAPNADVLLLGDSFTNIFSLAEMNWGEAAGLAEHLSLAGQRPIDRIAQNDAGAFATRQTLALELGRGQDRLAGKRLVIWEFAARELAVGDWKIIPLPRPRHSPAPVVPQPSTEDMQVEGRVVAAAAVPPPGSVPYRDAVTAVHVADVAGVPNKEAVVYLWGMRDNRLTAAAHLQHEARVRLKLTPWAQAEKRYGRYSRVELDDPDFTLVDLPTFWGELVQ